MPRTLDRAPASCIIEHMSKSSPAPQEAPTAQPPISKTQVDEAYAIVCDVYTLVSRVRQLFGR
jgi:hypothetical protein